MKKMFTLMLFTVVSAFSAAEAVPAKVESMPKSPITAQKYLAAPLQKGVLSSSINEFESKTNATQASPSYILLDTVQSSLLSSLSYSTPLTYDPISKSVVSVANFRVFTASNAFDGCYLRVGTLTNGSSKFTVTKTPFTSGEGVFYPSISVGSGANGAAMYISGMGYKKSGTNWGVSGIYQYFYESSSSSGTVVFDEEGPTTNLSGVPSNWSIGKFATYNTPTESRVYAAGILSPKTSSYQYGFYGVRSFALYPGIEPGESIAPQQWWLDKYKQSTQLNSSYQSKMLVDVDSKGNVYTAVNNLFAEDENHRVPGVSKSTDQGKTWTSFNQLPQSLLDTYAADNGFTSSNMLDVYAQDAFVVTGENEYSYFFRYGKIENNLFTAADILEARYKAGNWSINKVATLSGMPNMPDILVDGDTTSGGSKYRFKLTGNDLGHELQAARTEDGQNILVKWIDYNTKLGEIPLGATYTFQVNDDETVPFQSLSSLPTTDVFMAYRPASGGTWTTNNVTSDTTYDKCTWIPQVIPSLNKVPMTKQVAIPYIYGSQADPYVNLGPLPTHMRNRVADLWQVTAYTAIDATQSASGVEENEVVANFEIKNISPNPVNNDVTEIIYSVDQATTVSLEVFDAMGKKVATAMPITQVMPGTYGINFNTNNISSGTYYITLNSNGKSVTKVLSVVK